MRGGLFVSSTFEIAAGQSGQGILSSATLAWSEPLTALLRSAQSRVSSSRSLWKAPTRTPCLSISISHCTHIARPVEAQRLVFDRTGAFAHNDRCRPGARTIAESFPDVRGRELCHILEISDRASDLEHPMITARGEAKALRRSLQKRPRFGVDGRVRVEPTPDRVGVAGYSRLFRESVALSGA